MDLDTQRLPCDELVVLMTRDSSSVMCRVYEGLLEIIPYDRTVPVPWLRHQANATACNAACASASNALLASCPSPFDCQHDDC